MSARPDGKSPWRKLSRRDFVAMLGAAAASALAASGRAGLPEGLADGVAADELAEARARRRRRRAGGRKTVWIGHC